MRRTAAVDISELTEPNTAVIAGLTRQLDDERTRHRESDRAAQGLALVVAELYRQIETLTSDTDQRVVPLAAKPARIATTPTRKIRA
jgi:hypothetical protein